MPVKTVRLKSGFEVTANDYNGELYAVTYTNMTQAKKAAGKLGAGYEARKLTGRPFYIIKIGGCEP